MRPCHASARALRAAHSTRSAPWPDASLAPGPCARAPADNHVLRKYEIIQKIGRGAYGIVWKAVDKKTRCLLPRPPIQTRPLTISGRRGLTGRVPLRRRETVALKKIFDAFQNATDAQRTFREIMFLQEMANHENIVRCAAALPRPLVAR